MSSCVRKDAVKGQSASRQVQIHCYSGRAPGVETYFYWSIIVPTRVPIISALQNPGIFIPSKTAVISFSAPTDSSVSHCNRNPSGPLYFPVTAITQTLSTQNLKAAIKSLRVIWIWLLLAPPCHFPVVSRQNEVSVCCVWVQREFTGI